MNVILLADNVPEFLDTRAEFLELGGFRVLRAYSLEQARQLLAEARVQLAILDIRLVDDDDDKDTSGLTLAKDPAYRSVPKIMLTGFPTYEAVREAMGPSVEGLPPAVNFLSKKEGPEAMIDAVRRALEEHVGINWDLQIAGGLERPPLFRDLVSVLQPSLPTDLLAQREGELEDLFRRLFREAEKLRIGQLLWQDSGRICLPVATRSPQGAVLSRLLVCGDPGVLRHEAELISELAPTGEQYTKLVDSEETMHFGALLFDLPDSDANAVQPLKTLITGGSRASARAAALSLLRTVRSWHDQGQTTEDADDLMALYRQRVGLDRDGLPRSELEDRVAALVQAVRPMSATEIELSAETLVFHFPSQRAVVCPNPVEAVYRRPEWQSGPVVCKVSPGELLFERILVDPQQQAWLSSVSRAGQAPQWWDYVCLEAGIRFDLSRAPDWIVWQQFEEQLVAPSDLHTRLKEDEVITDLRTAMILIQAIRRQAGSETGLDPLPYYAGLLTWAVGATAQYSPGTLYTRTELMRGAHFLLAAGMIAHRIDELLEEGDRGALSEEVEDQREGTAGTLSLDEDGVTVRIGPERRVPLSGQELELFRCLYEQAGQVVSRQALVELVFKERYNPMDENQDPRLNSLVSRLRDKIEAGHGKARYIQVVRGQGYRLVKGKEDTD